MSDNKNKPEDPIEKLFQKKVVEFDIPYREKDWQKLEKRLDLADQQHGRMLRRRWLIAASVLLFSLMGYFTYDNYTNINRLNEQLSSESAPELQEDAIQNDLPQQNDSENPVANEEDVNGDQSLAEGIPAGDNTDRNNNDIRSLSSNSSEESGTGSSGQYVAEKSIRDLYISEFSCPTCTLSNLAARDERSGNFTLPEASSEEDENHIIASADRNTSAAVTSNGIGGQNTSRFSLGFVLSPDISTAGSISNFSDVGYKMGVTFEYKLSPRISITGGFLQSDVRYIASGDDYRPPESNWPNGVLPNETFAQCIILDIPVNLKYEFMQFTRSRFFASAGLSSYIMLNEDYQFYYNSYETGQRDSWSNKTGTGHWLSNAGFSIGYELDIHQNWSLRAEPFLKVPLSEVGWANVNLYSMGSFFSINYKL